jgi:hypothetical protein
MAFDAAIADGLSSRRRMGWSETIALALTAVAVAFGMIVLQTCQLLPAAACVTASLQGSLTSERWDFMQASIRPPPGFTSAQTFLTSALHAFEIAAAFTRTAWQGAETSLKCDLIHALTRPSPG